MLLLISSVICMADGPVMQSASAAPERDSALDRHKQRVDSRVQRASQWVDSFFNDPDYEAEIATSQIRVRPEIYYRDEQGFKLRMRTSAKFSLPNLDRRVSLFVGKVSDEGELNESAEQSGEDSVIGVQFFGKWAKDWHFSALAGAKFNAFAFFAGPRLRYGKAFTNKDSYRFTQALLWQTNSNWQIRSRLDFNHVFNDQYLFRQTFDGRWLGDKSDRDGYLTRISSFLTHRLTEQAGLQYEFSTIVHTQPNTHVDRYTVALRYRRQTARDWLYYEVVPQISFEDRFNFKANPGIRLRLEIFYGHNRDDERSGDEEDEQDGFRW